MPKPTVKAVLVLLACTVVYYWKILLTNDYSLLSGYEGLCQGYGWLQYWIFSIRHGVLPLWDPYALAGHPFPGEMQTSAFYPLNFLLALFPLDRDGVFSPTLFHLWFAFVHFLGGCFMFALAREFGLRRFPSVIAGVCFSLGGFVGTAGWIDMVNSAIWLPLIFLFLVRALKSENAKRTALYASLSGLALGMSILGGRLHMAMMQALFVVGAAAFAGLSPQVRPKSAAGRAWSRPAMVLAIVAGVAFCAGAVQLLPSVEYSSRALRFIGADAPLVGNQRIPSNFPTHGLWPQGIWAALLATAFGGHIGGGEVSSFRVGVFPLLAAVIGIWKCWAKPWVRFLVALGAVAFLYSMAEFSGFYGVTRAVVPYLWMLREASRVMYLAHFALALLAAFGFEALLYTPADEPSWRPLTRVLTWIAVICVLAPAVPGVYGAPAINPWMTLSILLILASYGVYRYIINGHSTRGVELLILSLVLFDLTSFKWTPANRLDLAKTGSDHYERLLSTRDAAMFLRSRPGRFRVAIDGNDPPPIGDIYRVPTVHGGMRATFLQNYGDVMGTGSADLFNPRYQLKSAAATEPGPVYQDTKWKVYENPASYPPAWIVHQTVIEPVRAVLESRLRAPGVDLHKQALVFAPLDARLEPPVEGAAEAVKFGACGANRLELTARASSRGLLVLSEVYYPGWSATVNGNPARIYEVDGVLRGVIIPRGESRVVLRYFPRTFWLGSLLSLAAFLGIPAAVLLAWRKNRGAGAVEPQQ